MKNIFEKTYEEVKAIKAALKENGVVKEKAESDYKAMKDYFKNAGDLFEFVYDAYKEALDNCNAHPDFTRIYQPAVLVGYLNEMGVKRFTYSATCTGAIQDAMEIQEAGAKMVGLTYINDHNSFSTGDNLKAAMLFEIV